MSYPVVLHYLSYEVNIQFPTRKCTRWNGKREQEAGRMCHIPLSWEAGCIFWWFNLSSPPRLIGFLIAFVCISNGGASSLYLLTSDDAPRGSFFCFKYLQLFIWANSCRPLLAGQHSGREIMSGIRLHDRWLWGAVNNYAVGTEKITACI